jgi:integrase
VANISKINGRYRAQIRRKGHQHISKWFDTLALAKAWARGIEAQMDAGQVPRAPGAPDTIAELVARYRRMRSKTRPIMDTSTEHYTLKQLAKEMGELVAARITTDDLISWAQRRRDSGAGPYTINCDLGKLGTVLRYAGEGLPDVVGAARPKLRYLGMIGGGGMRERRPTEDEAVRVLEWLATNKGQIYADFARFGAITAMRRGEVARILWADVDHAQKMVMIRDRKDPRQKVGNDQWIPLLGDSWALLQRQPEVDERIFPVHPQTMSKYFTEACRTLDIPDLHLHDLRHEGISQMFEQGFDIPQVAVVSGHKDWRHLKRYTQIKPASLHDHGKRPDTPPHPDSLPTAARRPGKSGS